MRIFQRRVFILLVGMMLVCGRAWADDDSGFTGDSGNTPPVKKTVHPKHKAAAKKKVVAESAAATSTNVGTASPPVTKPMVDSSAHEDSNGAPASSIPVAPASNDGRVATLGVSALRDFEANPPAVQRLLGRALALTDLGLSYKYGSSDPQNGGMDCSGTIYYLLAQTGLKDVPRDAGEMYRWVWTRGDFRSVVSFHPDTFELERLRPGDLLFWSGTYRVDRDPPITHVMIYLGINRDTGRRVMVGASEGRRFNDKPRYGVSVFDFTMPGPEKPTQSTAEAPSDLQARFVGYGSIPGLDAAESDPSKK